MDSRYLKELIEEDIKSLGCVIWGIELSGKPRNTSLRVFIDKENGISIDDCEKVSKHISKVLDADNFINNFSLEVSSPGLERKFYKRDQYASYLKQPFAIRYRTKDNNFVTEKGILDEVSQENVVLKSGRRKLFISFDCIEKANLDYKGES